LADVSLVKSWEVNGIVGIQSKLADFVYQLQSAFELSPSGIPYQYIDPTVIAECVPYFEDPNDISEEKLKSAIIPIDYEDGVPIANGVPLWERLDGERIEYYNIYKQYRDMKYALTTKTRSLAALAEECNVSGKHLAILARIYHWMIRVKCYDDQKAKELALKKQAVAEELENKHAKYSNQMLENSIKWLAEHPASMTAKVAVQMVELGMKYGRISVGLQGDKPGTTAVAHQTNIAIQQSTTQNNADQMVNVTGGSTNQSQGRSQISSVERQLTKDMQNTDNLLSVLHVLNKSGALKNAAGGNSKEVETLNEEEYDIDRSTALDVETVDEETNATDTKTTENQIGG
jgi:hypothetical protein